MSAIEILDKLGNIQDDFEKICLLQGVISDEYFCGHDRETEGGRFGIVCEFTRNGIYSDIVYDYIIKAKDDIDLLKKDLEVLLRKNED
jgi:hypothetical protein